MTINFTEYLNAFDVFRDELEKKPDSVISLAMHRAAKKLSDTPKSAWFLPLVKQVELGEIYSNGSPDEKRHFLNEQAGFASLRCYEWHHRHEL